MPLVFTVTNVDSAPVTLQLLGRVPTADFRVTDLHGRSIWSLLRGETLLGPLRLVPLEAGESLSFQYNWDQHTDDGKAVAPGEYVVRGVLLTDERGGLSSEEVRLRIDT